MKTATTSRTFDGKIKRPLHRLRRFILLAAFLNSFLFSAAAQQTSGEINCRLILKDRMLDVKIEMPPNKFDKTSFNLTDWAGQKNYAENLYRIAARDKSGADLPLEKTGERTWTIVNRQKAFDLTYTIVAQKDNFMGGGARNHFHPTLFKDYVFLWGSSFLLYPEAAEILALPVKLQIIPNEYGNFYSNFDGRANSFDELSELFIAAGDYRVAQKNIGGRKVEFLLQGKNWKFTDEQFIAVVTQIFAAQVDYMGFSPASEKMLVTLNEGTPNSKGGTVVKNVISVYPNLQVGLQDFETLKLIAHEHFHTWNGNYWRGTSDKTEGYYKWMSEGFTEYYAGLTLHRENLVSEKEYIKWLNNLLLEYQTNPFAFTATAAILSENYWKSNDYNRLPYVKGALLALLTDLQIRQKSAGKKQIDDFMRFAMSKTDKEKGYDDNLLLASLNSVTSSENRQFYDEFALGAKFLPIVEILKKSDIAVAPVPRDVFDLGFTTESGRIERGVKIKQIAASSAAFKAGLREGDELRSFSFNGSRPQDEATFTVQRGDESVPVRFYPKKSIDVLQIAETAVIPK